MIPVLIKTTRPPILLRVIAAAALLGGVVSCQSPDATSDGPLSAAAPPPPIEYNELARQYNARLTYYQQLRAGTDVTIEWTDDEGNDHIEEVSGPLILREPLDAAMHLGKAGVRKLFLGSNATHFWLIDTREAPPRAWVGEHAYIAMAGADWPLPVRPDQLSVLMGLERLPATPPPDTRIEAIGSGYRLRLPQASKQDGARQVIDVSADDFAPRRIALHHGDDSALGHADLSDYESLEIETRPEAAWPRLATHFVITIAEPPTQVTLKLASPREGRGYIQDKFFDLDRFLKSLNVDDAHVYRLAEAPKP